MPDVRSQMVYGPLQTVSIAYRNTSYVADRVFPIMDGVDPKCKILKYKKGAWFRDEAGIRAPGTRSKRGTFPVSSESLSTAEYSFASPVTKEDRRLAKSQNAPPLKPDQDAIEYAADRIDLKKERRVAAAVTGTTWVDGASGGEDAEGLWSPAGSTNTFLADVKKAIKAIKTATGLKANAMLIDYATYMALKECAEILDKIKYTQRGVLTRDLLAAILELEDVIIGEAVYSTADEAADGDDFTARNIWEVNAGKGMGFVFYRPRKLGLKVVTAGMQYRLRQDNGKPRWVETWYEAPEKQDVYDVGEESDITEICADAGYLFKDTYST